MSGGADFDEISLLSQKRCNFFVTGTILEIFDFLKSSRAELLIFRIFGAEGSRKFPQIPG